MTWHTCSPVDKRRKAGQTRTSVQEEEKMACSKVQLKKRMQTCRVAHSFFGTRAGRPADDERIDQLSLTDRFDRSTESH